MVSSVSGALSHFAAMLGRRAVRNPASPRHRAGVTEIAWRTTPGAFRTLTLPRGSAISTGRLFLLRDPRRAPIVSERVRGAEAGEVGEVIERFRSRPIGAAQVRRPRRAARTSPRASRCCSYGNQPVCRVHALSRGRIATPSRRRVAWNFDFHTGREDRLACPFARTPQKAGPFVATRPVYACTSKGNAYAERRRRCGPRCCFPRPRRQRPSASRRTPPPLLS